MEEGQEKKFPPSAKKIRNARAQGQVARSAEVAPTVRFIFVGLITALLIPVLYQHTGSLYLGALKDIAGNRASARVGELTLFSSLLLLKFALAIAAGAGLAGVIADFVQIGPNYASKAQRFQLSRLHPVTNLKQVFSLRSVMRLLLGTLKFVIAGIICLVIVIHFAGDLLLSSRSDFYGILDLAAKVAVAAFFWSCVMLGTLAAADFAYERHRWYKNLFMTREELKREQREQYGDPQVKAKMKALMKEDSRGTMMSNLKFCQVFVQGSDGQLVGLYYNVAFFPEPLVLVISSKENVNEVAAEADANGIPIIPNAALVKSIASQCQPGTAVPKHDKAAVLRQLASVGAA